jgi:predicted flavoprotein YhiN
MAAEVLSQAGVQVDVYDAMPSVGRKFLMAGKGGMNITHAEPFADFITRYGTRQAHIEPLLNAFPPDALREWIHELGIATFVGTSNRVFPTDMKAAPLLRAWLHRLRENGVQFHMRHRWVGWDEEGALRFEVRNAPHPERALLGLQPRTTTAYPLRVQSLSRGEMAAEPSPLGRGQGEGWLVPPPHILPSSSP